MNKKTSLLALLGLLALPSLASAQTLGTMAEAAMNAVVTAVGFIVVIMWIVTAVLFLLAQGDPAKLSAAKLALISSVAGTIIVIIANVATSFVAGIFGLNA